jgi:hypothetical protein
VNYVQMDPATARRIAENESRFREANEKIEDAALRLEPDATTLPFVCECGRSECLQTIRLSLRDYEQARQQGTFFVCAPGHEITGEGVGRVVRQTDDFVIMEKLGLAGAIAEERDPRAAEIEDTG